MTVKTKAIIALLFVSLSYTLLGVGARMMGEGFGPLTQVYVRVAVGALLAILLFSRKIRWQNILNTPRKDYVGLILMGAVGYGLSVYFITEGVLRTTLLTVSVIYSTFPFFTYLYSALVFKRKLDWRLVGLIVISFWGVMMIAGRTVLPKFDALSIVALYVALSAATGAWYVIGRKLISNHLKQEELTVVIMTIATITILSGALITGEGMSWNAFSMLPVLIGLAIGAVLNLVSTYLDNFAFKILDEVFASQLLLSENIFAIFIGVVLYHERVYPIELLGALIICGSVFFSNYLTAKSSE